MVATERLGRATGWVEASGQESAVGRAATLQAVTRVKPEQASIKLVQNDPAPNPLRPSDHIEIRHIAGNVLYVGRYVTSIQGLKAPPDHFFIPLLSCEEVRPGGSTVAIWTVLLPQREGQ